MVLISVVAPMTCASWKHRSRFIQDKKNKKCQSLYIQVHKIQVKNVQTFILHTAVYCTKDDNAKTVSWRRGINGWWTFNDNVYMQLTISKYIDTQPLILWITSVHEFKDMANIFILWKKSRETRAFNGYTNCVHRSAGWTEQGFTPHSTQNRSFRTRSSVGSVLNNQSQ